MKQILISFPKFYIISKFYFVLQIPLVKLAQSLRQDPIRMFASPWNAPAWMKSNHEVNGKGFLLPEFYPAWANYFVKFLDHYKEQGTIYILGQY